MGSEKLRRFRSYLNKINILQGSFALDLMQCGIKGRKFLPLVITSENALIAQYISNKPSVIPFLYRGNIQLRIFGRRCKSVLKIV